MDYSEYVRRLLDAYRATPGTCGAIRQPDRAFARQLHARGVPLKVVENALVLACARRLARPAEASCGGCPATRDPLTCLLFSGY
jgi:hypothetical protein